MVGKIQRVALRDVWRHEAYDFSSWLSENIDVLSEVIGVELINVETERRAGDFCIDLVAEDNDGGIIVIENQLEKSDHDHLGKLVVYKTAFEARAAIWIVGEARNEHVKAVNWLNETTDSDFYMLKLEAIKIEDSAPAPLLTLIVGPSAESRVIGTKRKEWAHRETVRYDFWTKLLDKAKRRTNLHSNISPNRDSWVGAGSGIYGLTYNYYLRKDEVAVSFYIDKGSDSEELNQRIFDHLKENKERIEDEFGEELEWFKIEGTKHCKISKTSNIGGWKDEEKWDEIQDWMIDSMIRLETVLKPYVKAIKSNF